MLLEHLIIAEYNMNFRDNLVRFKHASYIWKDSTTPVIEDASSSNQKTLILRIQKIIQTIILLNRKADFDYFRFEPWALKELCS
ncbi:hypothetical protein L1987_13954 [Smallanthus sonchifolius]|uniref:Uncharacterized protein n=1 Tax=Smallanthus sonchifolius TaxID=185202 RepID=A0ACB9JK72_9ASTR|nr:hypothetical protein L1987_13954 [Smallanthus sonchifolius]